MVLLTPIYEQTIVMTIILVLSAVSLSVFFSLVPTWIWLRWVAGAGVAIIAAFTALHWWIVWGESRDNRRRRAGRRYDYGEEEHSGEDEESLVINRTAMGQTLETVKEAEFFNFFNLSETGRGSKEDGSEVITFQTDPEGSFYDFVVVDVTVDVSQRICGVVLKLDRAFVDDPQNGLFARDIAKSMLGLALPPADASTVGDLIDAIAGPMLSTTSTPRSGPAHEGYRVFQGQARQFEETLARSRLTLQNIETNEQSWLNIGVMETRL